MDGFSLNFSWKRLAVLAALLFVYFLLGGFDPPNMTDTGLSQRSMTKSWIYMIVLFGTGAASATIVDHEFGLLPPRNYHIIYVILGLFLMGASLTWMYSVRTNVPAHARAEAFFPSNPIFSPDFDVKQEAGSQLSLNSGQNASPL